MIQGLDFYPPSPLPRLPASGNIPLMVPLTIAAMLGLNIKVYPRLSSVVQK